jgi:hypothetical protein
MMFFMTALSDQARLWEPSWDNRRTPVRFLSPRSSNPLGSGMPGWASSVDPTDPQYFAQPAPLPQPPGGLPGLTLEYLRNNPDQ